MRTPENNCRWFVAILAGLLLAACGSTSKKAEDAVDTAIEEIEVVEEEVTPEIVCEPNCEWKECGGDGCGGSCGECAIGLICGDSWKCLSEDCSGQPYVISGGLKTSAGEVLFNRVAVQMYHKTDPDPEVGGCIAVVALDFDSGNGCRLHAKAGGILGPAGELTLQEFSFDADSNCEGLASTLFGSYADIGGLTKAHILLLSDKVEGEGPETCFPTSLGLKLEGRIDALAAGLEMQVEDTSILVTGNVSSLGNPALSCPCLADCEGKKCGGDGCGGSCGDCVGDSYCQDGLCMSGPCQPQCDGKECGGDGCTGICGECGCGEICDEDLCEFIGCEGKECGSDGCGGSCGECEGENELCVDGTCTCVPTCIGVQCGEDGCGGSCGECSGVQEACVDGSCVCQPDCEGKECGADGCGGVCGECDPDCFCLASQCFCDCPVESECEDGEVVCAGDSGYVTCEQLAEPCQDFWHFSDLSVQCEEGTECSEGECICLPDCEGKDCGEDGCGGICGECLPDTEACVAGQCKALGDVGKPCAIDADCTTDGGCYAGFCTAVCRMAGELVPGACEDSFGGSDWGPLFACPVDLDICMPGNVDNKMLTCASDDDCASIDLAGFACALSFAAADGSVAGKCMPPGDRAPAGAPCDGGDGSGCTSLICLHPDMDLEATGVCAAYCGSPNTECPEGTLCTAYPFYDGDEAVGYGAVCAPFGGSQEMCQTTADCQVGKEYCGAVVDPEGLGWDLLCLEAVNPEGGWLGDPCTHNDDCLEQFCMFGTWANNVEAYCTRPCTEDASCNDDTVCRQVHFTPFEGVLPDGAFETKVCLRTAETSPCFVEEDNPVCEFEWSICEPIPGGVGWLGSCVSAACPPSCEGKACKEDDGCGTPCLDACLADGETCLEGTECLSDFCADGFCCGTACDGLCESCGLFELEGICSPLAGGDDPDLECGACLRCNGAGECAPLPAGPEPGELCPICQVCDGEGACLQVEPLTDPQFGCEPCFVCSEEGECVPVEAGLDPKDGCEEAEPESCLTTGVCNGAGECELWLAETPCSESVCEGTTDFPPSLCDGLGVCVPQEGVPCAPYTCATDAPECLVACEVSEQCTEGNWCAAGLCEPFPECPAGMKLLCNSMLPATTAPMENDWENYDSCVPAVPYQAPDRIYAINMPDDTLISFTATDMAFDVALFLLEDACNPSLACTETADLYPAGGSETITFLAEASEQYYFAVDGITPDDKGELMIGVDCCTLSCEEEKACGDDGCGGSCGTCLEGELCHEAQCHVCAEDAGGEPNDLCLEAMLLEEGEYDQMLICPENDVDWFAVELSEGDSLTTLLEFDSEAVNLDLALFAADCETLVVESTSETEEELLQHLAFAPETYYLRILSPDGGQAGYSLTVSILAPECLTDEECLPGEECGLYECTAPPEPCETVSAIACGDSLQEDTSGLPDLMTDYTSCTSTPWPGAENIYSMTHDVATVVTLGLSGLPEGGALAVLEEFCASEWACIDSAVTDPLLGPPQLTVRMEAGIPYWVVIDGLSTEDFGPYTVTAECCVPSCEDKVCGDDGCGMNCGDCPGPQDACVDGACVCQPACEGMECGPDGCEGICGECLGPQDLCEEGLCVCQPNCEDKVCGDDGCGGSCGECEGEQMGCVEGACECIPDCEVNVCGEDGCGGICGVCEGPQDLCQDGACICQPACEGMVCGDDGCGSVCGTCPGPQDVCEDGACICIPDCVGKVCGDDGCAGSCGECSPGYGCSSHQCSCLTGYEANESCGAAKSISAGNYPNLGICPGGDKDWYAVALSAGQTITVTIEFIHKDGDLDLFLYKHGNCVGYLTGSSSSTDNETITYKATSGATYYLMVTGFWPNTINNYVMDLSVQ